VDATWPACDQAPASPAARKSKHPAIPRIANVIGTRAGPENVLCTRSHSEVNRPVLRRGAHRNQGEDRRAGTFRVMRHSATGTCKLIVKSYPRTRRFIARYCNLQSRVEMRILRFLFLLSLFSTLGYILRGGMRGGGSRFRGAGFAGGGGVRGGFVGGRFRDRFVSPGFQGNFRFVNRPFFLPGNQFFFPRNRFFFRVGLRLPFPASYGYPFYGSYYCDPYCFNCPGYYGSTAFAPDYARAVAAKPALAAAPVPATTDRTVTSADPASRVQPVSATGDYSLHQEADYYLIAFPNHTIKGALVPPSWGLTGSSASRAKAERHRQRHWPSWIDASANRSTVVAR
jgi:hypothetical protein